MLSEAVKKERMTELLRQLGGLLDRDFKELTYKELISESVVALSLEKHRVFGFEVQ